MKRVGFYGGSFNPCHAGHQATVMHALATAQLDELYVAPVYKHPYGKELVDFEHRLNMCSLMLQPFSQQNGAVTTTSVECRAILYGERKGYTADTVAYFIAEYYRRFGERPHVVLIMGSDLRADVPKWKGYDRLQELCMAGWASLFFVERVQGLSSTAVRENIEMGGYVDRWLPKGVHEYAYRNQLYGFERGLGVKPLRIKPNPA